MADDQQVLVRGVSGWVVRPKEDGDGAFFIFNTKDGAFGFALSARDLSNFVGRILKEASQSAQTHSREPERAEILSGVPVPVQSVGIAMGRDTTEAILALRTSFLTLTYSVDTTMLAGSCQDFLAMTVRTAPKSTPS